MAVDYACRAEEAEGQSASPLLHAIEEPKNLVSQLSLEDITKGLADLSLLARVRRRLRVAAAMRQPALC